MHRLERMQVDTGKSIAILDVNDQFKHKYVNYCKEQGYSQNTMQRSLVTIKTVCKHARFMGLETNPQLDSLRLDRERVKSIYLTPQELKDIKEVELKEYLDNARDWLLISCYTGQRISDFMKFTKEMLREEKGKLFLEFTQQKTKKIMTIPVAKQVRDILDKRNGEFPRAISDANYNEYIKTVCEQAKINQVITGAKKEETAPKSGVFRKKEGLYKKYELVSSHVGRRSFATNHYGQIPTSILIYMTGHSTEAQFLEYIHKSNKDLAMQAANYFD